MLNMLILTSLSLCIFIYEERLHAAVEIGRAKTPTPVMDIDSEYRMFHNEGQMYKPILGILFISL